MDTNPTPPARGAPPLARPEALPQRTFRVRQGVWLTALASLILGWVGGLALAALAVQRYLITLATYGPARLWSHTAPSLLSAGALLAIGALSAGRVWHLAGYQVQLHRAGIVIQRGRRRRRVRWEDMASLRQSAVRYALLQPLWRGRAELELTLKNGQRLVLDQRLENFSLLTQAIKAHIYPQLLHRYRNAFNRGEPVRFGPLLLTQQGVINGKRALKWDEIAEVKVQRGRLTIRPLQGRGFSVPTDRVPNFDLCLQWIRQLSLQP